MPRIRPRTSRAKTQRRERFDDSRPYLYDPEFWTTPTWRAGNPAGAIAEQHNAYRGDIPAAKWITCHRCNGLGSIVYPAAVGDGVITKCPRCRGRRKVLEYQTASSHPASLRECVWCSASTNDSGGVCAHCRRRDP